MFQKQFSPKISFTITGVVEVFIRSKPSWWLFTENSWWKKNKFSIEPDKEGELIYLWHLNPLPPLFLLQPLSQMWLPTRFNDQHITLVTYKNSEPNMMIIYRSRHCLAVYWCWLMHESSLRLEWLQCLVAEGGMR